MGGTMPSQVRAVHILFDGRGSRGTSDLRKQGISIFMLEQPSLLLRPWIYQVEDAPAVIAGAGWARRVVHPASEKSLGVALWGIPTSLLAWLGHRRIQVFESVDESQLMSLTRPWGLSRGWDVRDAEDRRVGIVAPAAIHDSSGARLATLCVAAEGSGDSAWRADDDRILASWHSMPGQGCFFHFGETVAANPFIRMILLAGALALPPWPGDVAPAIAPSS
jgi:hypothetical protein